MLRWQEWNPSQPSWEEIDIVNGLKFVENAIQYHMLNKGKLFMLDVQKKITNSIGADNLTSDGLLDYFFTTPRSFFISSLIA